MRPFGFAAPWCLRACAVLLTLLCARGALAQSTPTSVTIASTFAGTQGPDAVPAPADGPSHGEVETSGCDCGAGSGGGSPFLMLGMWLAFATLQSRRRSRAS